MISNFLNGVCQFPTPLRGGAGAGYVNQFPRTENGRGRMMWSALRAEIPQISSNQTDNKRFDKFVKI